MGETEPGARSLGEGVQKWRLVMADGRWKGRLGNQVIYRVPSSWENSLAPMGAGVRKQTDCQTGPPIKQR